MIKRVGILYGIEKERWLQNKLAFYHEQGRESEAEELLASYRVRMNDLSEFVKALKSRMTIYYNNNFDREGTLWECRFHSIILEKLPNLELLRVIAAYIDLNPVRAKLVSNPLRYGWNGAGDSLFEKGLEHLFPAAKPEQRSSLYAAFLRSRAAKKRYVPSHGTECCALLDVGMKNNILTRSRAIGSPAFIASIAGEHPPGGITAFQGEAGGTILTVGRLTRRKFRKNPA